MNEYPPLKSATGKPLFFYTGDGANQTWTFALKDANGDAFSLTGYTLRVTMRADPDSATDLFSPVSGVALTQSGSTLGKFTADFSGVSLTTPMQNALMYIYNIVATKHEILAVHSINIIKGKAA